MIGIAVGDPINRVNLLYLIDVDRICHMVPLNQVHDSSGHAWIARKRKAQANNLLSIRRFDYLSTAYLESNATIFSVRFENRQDHKDFEAACKFDSRAYAI